MTGGTAGPGAAAPIAEGPRPKEYAGGGVTVAFEPRRCPHAAECVRGPPEVFGLSRRPWALPDAAAPEKVAEVVRRRPSGALRYRPAEGGGRGGGAGRADHRAALAVRAAGAARRPAGQGRAGARREARVVLCGCGASADRPYRAPSGRCAEQDGEAAGSR